MGKVTNISQKWCPCLSPPTLSIRYFSSLKNSESGAGDKTQWYSAYLAFMRPWVPVLQKKKKKKNLWIWPTNQDISAELPNGDGLWELPISLVGRNQASKYLCSGRHCLSTFSLDLWTQSGPFFDQGLIVTTSVPPLPQCTYQGFIL
jgi:hypothetical protein